MRGFAAQFFRSIPGSIGSNAMVAFGSAALFLVGYEFLTLIKSFGYGRSLQILAGLAVLLAAAGLSARLLRSLWRRFRILTTAKF